MRRVVVVSAAVCAFLIGGVAASARAEPPCGAIDCPDPWPPRPTVCDQNGINICSAGDFIIGLV